MLQKLIIVLEFYVALFPYVEIPSPFCCAMHECDVIHEELFEKLETKRNINQSMLFILSVGSSLADSDHGVCFCFLLLVLN
jgi:hypothetical protein